MTHVPPYLRTPYLWSDRDDLADDRVLLREEVERWLSIPVVVEEKLDGANVSIWLRATGRLDVASRGGTGAMDRAGQLGRLRAWVAERDEVLRGLLVPGTVLYAEWLWLTHGTQYDALPDWLVVLDIWRSGDGFASLDQRDRLAGAAGLVVPPRRFDGVLHTRRRVEQLLGRSAYCGSCRAEGLVLRSGDGGRCKLVDPRYRRRSDDEWRDRQHNQLAQ